MTISVLQEKQTSNGSGSASSIQITLNNPVTANSSIHVFCTSSDTNTGFSCSDNVNGSYGSALDNIDTSGDQERVAQFVLDHAAAGTTTVTVTPTSSAAFLGIWVKEIGGTSGRDSGGTGAGHAGQAGVPGATTTDILSTGNMNPTTAPGLVSAFSTNTSNTLAPLAGTGYTAGINGWDFTLGAGNSAISESLRYTSTGARAATFTPNTGGGSNSYTNLAVIFIESASGSAVLNVEDDFATQFDNDVTFDELHDFVSDSAPVGPNNVVAPASFVYYEEWEEFFTVHVDPLHIPGDYQQSDVPPPNFEDPWLDEYVEDFFDTHYEQFLGANGAAAATIICESLIEDFAEETDDETWITALNTKSLIPDLIVQTPLIVNDEDYQEDTEEFFADHFVNEDNPPSLLLTLEDAWPHDDFAEDEWYVDEFPQANFISATLTFSSDEEYSEDVEEFFADHFVNEDNPILAGLVEDGWQYFDEVVEDDWQTDYVTVADVNTAQLAEDAWPHFDESVEDDAQLDGVIGPDLVVQTFSVVAAEEDFNEDVEEFFADHFVNEDLFLPVSNEDVRAYFEDYAEDFDYDQLEYSAFPTTTDKVEDAWPWTIDDYCEDYEILPEDEVGPDYIPPSAPCPEDAWLHDDFVEDYDTLPEDSVGADNPPLPVEDTWQHFEAELAEDYEVLPEDNVGLDAPALTDDPWPYFDEFVEDYEVLPEDIVGGDVQPTAIEDAWPHDDFAEDYDVLPEDIVGADIPPTLVEDAWDWYEEVPDDTDLFVLDMQVGANGAVAQPFQDFGDDSSYLEEWLIIDDDADWYTIGSFIVEAAQTRMYVKQHQTVLVVRGGD